MSIFDKINNGDYKTKLEYPTSPKKPSIRIGATAEQARRYAEELEAYPFLEEQYKRQRELYGADTSYLERQFKLDLEDEYDVPHDHPKANLLYGKAYERGHSGGLYEVALVYDDLVELIL